MLSGRYFNPDDYLEAAGVRVFTPASNATAFDRAYTDLERALQSASPASRLFVVVGVQGGGKTSWIRSNADQLGYLAYFFDAALPRAVHRARAISISTEAGVPAVAVWVRASLEIALERNKLRRIDHRVPDVAIRSVHSIMEPPSAAEGFIEVMEVEA